MSWIHAQMESNIKQHFRAGSQPSRLSISSQLIQSLPSVPRISKSPEALELSKNQQTLKNIGEALIRDGKFQNREPGGTTRVEKRKVKHQINLSVQFNDLDSPIKNQALRGLNKLRLYSSVEKPKNEDRYKGFQSPFKNDYAEISEAAHEMKSYWDFAHTGERA